MKQVVLVVDDDQVSLKVTGGLLEASGYEARCASDAASALDFLADQKPSVILLDVVMPDVSGIELLGKLKDDFKTSDIPVILVTAKRHDEDVLSGYKYGADYYITKPFTAKQLTYGIRLVLGEVEQDSRNP